MLVFRITYDLTGVAKDGSELWGYFGLSCTSILNLVALLLDPAFQNLLGLNKRFASLGPLPASSFYFTGPHIETIVSSSRLSEASLLGSPPESSPAKWASDYCRLLIFRRL